MRALFGFLQRPAVAQRTQRLRRTLEYMALRAVLGALRMVPLDPAARVLAAGCRIYSSRSRRHGRALANIARAMPETTDAERQAIVLGMWENVGRVIAEAAHLDTFLAEPHRLEPLEMKILDDYTGQRYLYLIIGMHTGNWEIGLLHTFRRGYEPAAFYRAIANPLVDRYVTTTRRKIQSGGMFAMRGEANGGASPDMRSRQLVNCLRNGGPLGILMDQYDPSGVVVPFFGQGVRVSRGPATLALQFRARICVARTIRVGRQCRFIGEAEVLVPSDTGNREADIQATTAAIMRRFEDWIRQFPEQWLWSQAPFLASDGTVLATELVPDRPSAR